MIQSDYLFIVSTAQFDPAAQTLTTFNQSVTQNYGENEYGSGQNTFFICKGIRTRVPPA